MNYDDENEEERVNFTLHERARLFAQQCVDRVVYDAGVVFVHVFDLRNMRRDYFAAQAMKGMVQLLKYDGDTRGYSGDTMIPHAVIAEESFRIADAMLQEGDKGE